MHVVLPEVDGRLFAGVVSFKSPGKRDPDLQFSRFAHRADADRIDAIAARVAAWRQLANTPAAERKLALILSTYPGRAHQMAHAVGLDALASTEALLSDLAQAGYDCHPGHDLATRPAGRRPCSWPLAAYQAALATLPEALQSDLATAWGAPEADPPAATAPSTSPPSPRAAS